VVVHTKDPRLQRGKHAAFRKYIKAGSVGLDICLISVLRWLHPSQEGWDRDLLQKEESAARIPAASSIITFLPLDFLPTH